MISEVCVIMIVDKVSGESNVTKANCDFDTDFCGYDNPKFTFGNFFKTDFQWSRHKGDIIAGTGILLSGSRPLGDHISGNGELAYSYQLLSGHHLWHMWNHRLVA